MRLAPPGRASAGRRASVAAPRRRGTASPATTIGPGRARRAPDRAPRPTSATTVTVASGRAARQRRASSAAGRARSPGTWVAMIRAPAQRARAGRGRAMIPSTSLSAIEPWTRVSGGGLGSSPPARYGRRSSRAVGERRRAGRVVGAVEQDLVARRPRGARGGPATSRSRSRGGGRRRRPSAMPAAASASSTASATAAFSAWCRPRSEIRVGPRPPQLDVDARRDPSRGPAAAATSTSGAPDAPRPAADDRERRRRSRPSPRRSPRSMIAAFSRAIAGIVSPSQAMWSSATFVIAATPPSQACVASSRPPSPTSTSATSTPLLGEPAEEHRGQQLELGRRAVSTLDTTSCRQDLANEPRERHRVDRPAVDLQPLAVADEVRLGRRRRRGSRRPAGRSRRGPARCPCRSSRRRAHPAAPAADRREPGGARVSEPGPAGSRTARARSAPGRPRDTRRPRRRRPDAGPAQWPLSSSS